MTIFRLETKTFSSPSPTMLSGSVAFVYRRGARSSPLSVGAAHRITGKALRLIDEGYAHSMDMNRLAEQTGVSLRTLERFFRGTTGHSIRAEIRERRLQKAATLLRETKADLAEVAAESGLGTAANLCALFKRRFHQTPADSRQNRPAT